MNVFLSVLLTSKCGWQEGKVLLATEEELKKEGGVYGTNTSVKINS